MQRRTSSLSYGGLVKGLDNSLEVADLFKQAGCDSVDVKSFEGSKGFVEAVE